MVRKIRIKKMRVWKSKRTFNGKIFTLKHGALKKNDATRIADARRKEGHNVRIIKGKDQLGEKPFYRIYIRRER